MLAIVTTHPIQYYAPMFRLLAERGRIPLKVFYTWGEPPVTKYDPGFNRYISWDLPLLEGYPYEFVANAASDPGSHHFRGIINPTLINRIKESNATAVLVFGWAYHSHLQAMRYFKNKLPVYFRGDSTLLDDRPGLKSLLRSLFLKWVYRHVDYTFYVGTHNKAYFQKSGLKPQQLIFAPHAVDNERFGQSRFEEVRRLRNRLGIGANEILITFAGKLEEKKNPQLLMEAFVLLNAPNCHLLLAGNGHLEVRLKQQAGAAANIHFMDFQNQSEMPVIYQSADIFCLPSQGPGETWGLAVNEAMACGRAILISDKAGCAADLVTDGDNGFIFKSNNIQSLLGYLQQLTASKAKLTAYGSRSRQRIADWSFTRIAEAIERAVGR